MSLSRADRSRVTEWRFTIDPGLLGAIFLLMGVGLILSMAASPAVALKKGLTADHFVIRHVAFSVVSVGILIGLSFLTPQGVRRFALGLFLVALAGLVVVAFAGVEINGARRWLTLGGLSWQPSEFLKPPFIVVTAWLLAESQRRPDMPALPLALLGLASVVALLLVQPDVGQTGLICLVWWVLFVVSGQPLVRASVLLACGFGLFAGAYLTFDYVRGRVDRFLFLGTGEHPQLKQAYQSFTEGGFFGKGPGAGEIKTHLPDAHTDFIFAVLAEEFGIFACLALVAIFAVIVFRCLAHARREADLAHRLTIVGLALLFGLQALINMAVNVGILPAKGITLPFISAGGSSQIAIAITLGLLLAMVRRRPGGRSLDSS